MPFLGVPARTTQRRAHGGHEIDRGGAVATLVIDGRHASVHIAREGTSRPRIAGKDICAG
jgi:hypothetical protein